MSLSYQSSGDGAGAQSERVNSEESGLVVPLCGKDARLLYDALKAILF